MNIREVFFDEIFIKRFYNIEKRIENILLKILFFGIIYFDMNVLLKLSNLLIICILLIVLKIFIYDFLFLINFFNYEYFNDIINVFIFNIFNFFC